MTRPVNLLDVPFVPSDITHLGDLSLGTPNKIVDMGSGDGRVLAKFAELFPDADLTGYELHQDRATQSANDIPTANIIKGNMWDADLSEADLVYLYWATNLMEGFYEVFWPQLPSGALVVSYMYEIEGLTPIQHANYFFVYQKP